MEVLIKTLEFCSFRNVPSSNGSLKKSNKSTGIFKFSEKVPKYPFLSLTKVFSRKFILHLSVAVAGSSFQVC